jgi:filamentous hemagglutinin
LGNFEIPANTMLYGGLPGQSEFYSVEQSLKKVNYDKAKYWESLQVAPHPTFGFRPKVGEYSVNIKIKVAIAKTLANPQYGVGGAWQVFVENYAKKITFIKEIPLK